MSVLIRGMEMPKSCMVCSCTDTEYGECVLDTEKRCPEDYHKRADWCPLITVPPHGRLIDADALNYTMLYKENWMHGTGVEAPAVWKKDIDAAPTIIPASEESE